MVVLFHYWIRALKQFWVVIAVMVLITVMMAVQKMNAFMVAAIVLLGIVILWTLCNGFLSVLRHDLITQYIHRNLKGRNCPYMYEHLWTDVKFLLLPDNDKASTDVRTSDEEIFKYALERSVLGKYLEEIHPYRRIQERGFLRLPDRYDAKITNQVLGCIVDDVTTKDDYPE